MTGLLALTDHVISGSVYAWIAVIVLPVNSALNPCLYTLSAIIARHVSIEVKCYTLYKDLRFYQRIKYEHLS